MEDPTCRNEHLVELNNYIFFFNKIKINGLQSYDTGYREKEVKS